MTTPTIRWGILSTGRIAGLFAQGLAALPDAQLLAVGSRSRAAADRFGDQHKVPRRYASYEALVADPDVDAIYVATPHNLHAENSLLALRHGKAVLCEKPFTINAAQAEVVIAEARQRKLFLMEAMWTRFLPAVVKARQLLADGAIGEVRMLQADFGYRTGFNPQSRTFAPDLGGGALLDVGIYPISLASLLFGQPRAILGAAHLGETGVDEQSAYLLQYAGGRLALLSSAVRTNTLHDAMIYGTDGWLRIHPPFWNAVKISVKRAGQDEEIIEPPRVGNGYNYEAAEVARCLAEDKLESDAMPLDESLSLMRTMDELRRQWGLKYPMEAS
jgi:predicted dehydrogenase